MIVFQGYEPTCAICRASLCPQNPLLPNFAVGSLVRQHIQALASSGRPEWQERGYRTMEWNKRVKFVPFITLRSWIVLNLSRSWKQQSDARAAKKKLRDSRRTRRPQRYYEVDDYPYVPPWLIDGGIEDEADATLVARVFSRRGTRSRR